STSDRRAPVSHRNWRVVIADDEPAARRGVRQLLAAHDGFAVVGEARVGREALAALSSLHPDVLFLDIQMPELGGFDVLRRARGVPSRPLVVFLTAYEQFAIKAFEAEATDYLVKPVSEERFAATMRRLIRRLSSCDAADEPTIVVPVAGGTRIIQLSEIDWIEAADYYARLWVGSKSYLVRESLVQLERRVGRHGFVRAHRQALVRTSNVRLLRNAPSGELVAVLRSGAVIPVSRRRRSAFVAAVRGVR
ncbi:MAG: LytR/AlgR family response regulator transcription factor, partial [Gemmatimonadales bacterium]